MRCAGQARSSCCRSVGSAGRYGVRDAEPAEASCGPLPPIGPSMSTDDLEQIIRKLVTDFLRLSGLPPQSVIWRFESSEDAYAQTDSDWPYDQVTLRFDLADVRTRLLVQTEPTRWLEELCAHEVVHHVQAPIEQAAFYLAQAVSPVMERIVTDLGEASCTRVTTLLLRALHHSDCLLGAEE